MIGADLSFRRAREGDVAAIVKLLAADPLGSQRERDVEPLPEEYLGAFRSIDGDANQQLILAHQGENIVGVLQLTLIPSLTYQGSWRGQIEGVRVAEAARSGGVGRRLVEHAISLARERGCRMVQLTTDKRRPRAIAFYEKLGFVASHEGMKLRLHPPEE